jgi:hypothetical protein
MRDHKVKRIIPKRQRFGVLLPKVSPRAKAFGARMCVTQLRRGYINALIFGV